MRIFLTILFLSFSFLTKAQFPYKQTLGNSSTLVYSRGGLGADSAFVFNNSYTDTTQANIGFIDGIRGALIRTADDNIWMRTNDLSRWVLVNGGGIGVLDTLPNPRWAVVQNAEGTNYKSTPRRIFHAKDYGVVADGVTDDWAAITAALNACNLAGGGVVVLPAGKMMTSRVIKFPLNAYDSSNALRSITLTGDVEPNYFSNPLSTSSIPPTYGSIIEGTFLGDSAIISSEVSSGSWGIFNFLNIRIENLAIRVRSKTGASNVAAQGTGIYGYQMAFLQIRNVSIGTTSNEGLNVQPLSTAIGVVFPQINNFVMVNADNLFVTGFYYGAMLFEHSSVDNIFIDGCYYGLYMNAGNHSMHINKACVARCKISVAAAGGTVFGIDNLSIEDSPTSGTWWQNTLDLEQNSTAHGYINYQRVQTNLGAPNNNVFNRTDGPYNVICLPLGENIQTGNTDNRPTIIPDAATSMFYNLDSSFVEVWNQNTNTWQKVGGSSTPGGSNKQIQYNNSSAFGGAAGFEYQSGASPNVSITAQNAAYTALLLTGASSQTADVLQVKDNGGTELWSVTSNGAIDMLPSFEDWYEIEDELRQDDRVGFDWISSGSGSAATNLSTGNIPNGWMFGVLLSTGTTNTGSAFVYTPNTPSGAYQPISFASGVRMNVGFKLQLEDLSTVSETYTFHAGFIDNNTPASATDGVYFRYTNGDSSGVWIMCSKAASTLTEKASSTTVAADTDYELEVSVFGGVAYYYINKVLAGTISTNVPGSSNYTSIGAGIVKSNGTTDRDAKLDWGKYGTRKN